MVMGNQCLTGMSHPPPATYPGLMQPSWHKLVNFFVRIYLPSHIHQGMSLERRRYWVLSYSSLIRWTLWRQRKRVREGREVMLGGSECGNSECSHFNHPTQFTRTAQDGSLKPYPWVYGACLPALPLLLLSVTLSHLAWRKKSLVSTSSPCLLEEQLPKAWHCHHAAVM